MAFSDDMAVVCAFCKLFEVEERQIGIWNVKSAAALLRKRKGSADTLCVRQDPSFS